MGELPNGVSLTIGNQAWPDVEDLVTSTETPGGLRECRFSLPSKGSKIRWDDPLVIYDSVHAAWPFVGRISRIHKTGLCFDFTATRSTRLKVIESTTGPGNPSHPSGIYAGRIYKPGSLMGLPLTDALQLCEAVFSGGINPLSGMQFVVDSVNVGGYTAEQIWNYISGLVSQFSTPLLWHVRGRNNLQLVDIDFQDLAARYRVHLDEDKIDEDYDSEQVITRAAVEYGNDQIYTASVTPASAGRKLDHTKYVNGSRDLGRLADAQGLAGHYLSRYGQFMATRTTLNMECGKDIVRVVPPLGSSDDWPLWLIESGHGIFLVDRPTDLAPYNEGLKFIIGTEYVWKEGKLTATCGVAGGGLDSTVIGTVDYNVNRLFFGPYNGPPGGNHPLADADLLPQVGPEILPAGTAGAPPVTSYGIAAFRAGQDALGGDPNVPYGKQIDPDLVPDEGLEANFNIDPTVEGFQGGVRTTPGTYNEFEIIVGNATGKIADSCVVEVYKDTATGDPQKILTITLEATSSRTAPITPAVLLGRKDFMLFKMTTLATTATWCAISLHAKKNFPALK